MSEAFSRRRTARIIPSCVRSGHGPCFPFRQSRSRRPSAPMVRVGAYRAVPIRRDCAGGLPSITFPTGYSFE